MITTSIFPGRYVQGAHALALLSPETSRLGKAPLVVIDPKVDDMLHKEVEDRLGAFDLRFEVFRGEASQKEIDRLVAVAESGRSDVVIGMGGGKTMDTAKAVAHSLGLPVMIIPSLASTDAPCSALSVIYTEGGAFERYEVLPRNPDVVLVDTALIAKAPVRFLASGMGDALATWFEAESCRIRHAGNMTGRPGSMTAYALSRLCYDTLMDYGRLAMTACEQGVVTSALERIVEANTLLSGLGFESGGLASCHAIHNGLTTQAATHDYWHGEKVTIGVLASLFLTDEPPPLIDQVYDFCLDIGLPVTLAGIGLEDASNEVLAEIAQASCAPGESIHNEPHEVSPETVMWALKMADAEGRRRSAKHQFEDSLEAMAAQ